LVMAIAGLTRVPTSAKSKISVVPVSVLYIVSFSIFLSNQCLD
jgi:hypothetical protein